MFNVSKLFHIYSFLTVHIFLLNFFALSFTYPPIELQNF